MIRNRILNCKGAVQSIIVDDEIPFSSSAGTCDCERCTFCNEKYGLIITENLRLTANIKLRILLS